MDNATAQVDGFIRKNKQWSQELTRLRTIVLDCGLTEEIKWRTPCYTLNGANVVILGVMKDYCALSFLKGVLLKDERKLLIQPGKYEQSARYIRMTNLDEVVSLDSTLRAYVQEAIEVEKAGLKVQLKKTSDFAVPEELHSQFNADPKFKAAFEALTPGRQRAYLIFFAGAKQSGTRASRVEKHRQRILEGKGLDD